MQTIKNRKFAQFIAKWTKYGVDKMKSSVSGAQSVIRNNPEIYKRIASSHAAFTTEMMSHAKGTALGSNMKTMLRALASDPVIKKLKKSHKEAVARILNAATHQDASAAAMRDAVLAVSKSKGGLLGGAALANPSVLKASSAEIVAQYNKTMQAYLLRELGSLGNECYLGDAAAIKKLSKSAESTLGSAFKAAKSGFTGDIHTVMKKHITTMRKGIAELKAKAPDDVQKELVEGMLLEDIEAGSLGSKNFWDDAWRTIKSVGGFAAGYSLIDWMIDSGKEISEAYLLMSQTQNAITVSPLWFRGEPYLAGLDGMTKTDGKDAGITDILKSRFDGMLEGLSYSADSYRDLYYQSQVEYLKIRQSATMAESEGSDAGSEME